MIDLSDDAPVETPEAVADRIRLALEHVPAERLVIAPDCGMKYLPRETAFAKLEAMVAGAAAVRAGLAAGQFGRDPPSVSSRVERVDRGLPKRARGAQTRLHHITPRLQLQ